MTDSFLLMIACNEGDLWEREVITEIIADDWLPICLVGLIAGVLDLWESMRRLLALLLVLFSPAVISLVVDY